MIRFLLLSDIHLLCLAKEHDIHWSVRNCFIQDLNNYCQANGKFDFLLVSGDIASKGDKKEYEKAFNFFENVCEAAHCSLQDVYIIPGNHDKNFNAERVDLRQIINNGLSTDLKDTQESSELFYKLLCTDTDAIHLLYSPFKEYMNFSLKMDSFESLMQKVLDNSNAEYDPTTDKAYYQKTLGFIKGYPINLYGINSCLTCDRFDENDDGQGHKMFLPMLSYNIPVEREGCINISMMHHPLEKIANGLEIGKCMDDKFHVQIYGHLHKPMSNANKSVRIQSGAFQPPLSEDDKECYFSVYNIVELEVNNIHQNDSLEVKLSVEKYNSDSNEFEHMNEESTTYIVPLRRQNNRWDNKEKALEKNINPLPDGISIRQVRLAFLQCDYRKNLINKYSNYQDNKSLNDNCITFLKMMEESGKLSELWEDLKNK